LRLAIAFSRPKSKSSTAKSSGSLKFSDFYLLFLLGYYNPLSDYLEDSDEDGSLLLYSLSEEDELEGGGVGSFLGYCFFLPPPPAGFFNSACFFSS
jgi:hypothetical protein